MVWDQGLEFGWTWPRLGRSQAWENRESRSGLLDWAVSLGGGKQEWTNGSRKQLSQRSNNKVKILGRGSLRERRQDQRRGHWSQNNSNWVSTTRMEPGARMAFESKPRWPSTFIFTVWFPRIFSLLTMGGLQGSRAKVRDLEPENWARVPALSLSNMWWWISPGF